MHLYYQQTRDGDMCLYSLPWIYLKSMTQKELHLRSQELYAIFITMRLDTITNRKFHYPKLD
jgi:hypothetical protein